MQRGQDSQQHRRHRRAMDDLENKLAFKKPADWSDLPVIRRSGSLQLIGDKARKSFTKALGRSSGESYARRRCLLAVAFAC